MERLNCKSLMIGDWVTGKKWRENPFQITRINDGGKFIYGKTTTDLTVGPVFFDELEPIPLTLEILEKNGFYWGYTSSEEYSISNMPEDIPIPLIMPDKHWCYDNEDGGEVTIELPNESDGGLVTVSNNDRSIEFIFDKSICLHELQHLLRLCGLSDLADNIKMEE